MASDEQNSPRLSHARYLFIRALTAQPLILIQAEFHRQKDAQVAPF
jgi:hypothetical protein